MIVNIALICRNRWPLTKQALDSLLANTPREMFTLTVFDDASSEADRKALEQWFTDHFDRTGKTRAHSITHSGSKPPEGVGGARNRCIEWSQKHYSRGDLLYLSDNDVYFTPGWLETLINAYATCQASSAIKKVEVLGGQHHPYNQPNDIVTLADPKRFVHLLNAVDGLSWLLSWDTWDRFGPFDANTTDRRSSEDVAFCLKVREAGYEVGAIDPPVVLNCGKTDTWGGTIPGADVAIREQEGVLIQ